MSVSLSVCVFVLFSRQEQNNNNNKKMSQTEDSVDIPANQEAGEDRHRKSRSERRLRSVRKPVNETKKRYDEIRERMHNIGGALSDLEAENPDLLVEESVAKDALDLMLQEAQHLHELSTQLVVDFETAVNEIFERDGIPRDEGDVGAVTAVPYRPEDA